MDKTTFENLNKDNCWNVLEEKFPQSMIIFNNWIDQYKSKVKWKTMMFKTKFHDLPIELQFGIIVQFLFDYKLSDTLIFTMDYTKSKAINIGNLKAKLNFYFDKLEKQQ